MYNVHTSNRKYDEDESEIIFTASEIAAVKYN